MLQRQRRPFLWQLRTALPRGVVVPKLFSVAPQRRLLSARIAQQLLRPQRNPVEHDPPILVAPPHHDDATP